AEAIANRKTRNGMGEARYHEVIEKKIINVQTHGSVVGQINGLVVTGFDDAGNVMSFGDQGKAKSVPSGLLEVASGIGKGVGPNTLKAMANIESFLKEKFGADGNREFWEGRVSFEQNYGGVDGDSATEAKTVALLSAISGVPIKQGLAITGSMDVHGNAQAIGG